MPQPQVLAGRYELGERIGRGGMADVYRAVDSRLDRPVAVKVFRPGTDAAGRRRFEAEARLVAGLAHAGLVPVYDVGLDGAAPFLVMQLVDGPNLAQQVASGALPTTRVAKIGAELARTLAYVHTRGIVHRDVKPSNVLLDPTGRVLLTDFGVSRLIDAARLTATAQVVGTAAYLAPEQVRGATAGPSADVYALGLVLLECLTGSAAYGGSNPVEIAVARLHRSPDVPAWLPPPLATTLTAMVATDPESRPAADDCGRRLAPLADESGAVAAAATATAPTTVFDRTPTRQLPAQPAQPARPAAAGAVAALRGVRHRHPRALGIGGLVLAAVALIAIVTGLLANAGTGGTTTPPTTAPASTPTQTPGVTTQITVPPDHGHGNGRDNGHGHGDNGDNGDNQGNGNDD